MMSMIQPLVYLMLQTVFFWFLVFILHRQKDRITLIPLYCYIALMTFLTHNLRDLGFAVVMQDWYFLIASFSFFTTLMLGILFLYLFEGPRAARLALWIIVLTSIMYVAVVGLLGLQVDTSGWVTLDADKMKVYFWSVTAIIADFFFIALAWEWLSRIKHLPQLFRVGAVIAGVYVLDTVLFVTGAFGGQPFYLSMLRSNLTIRLILALIAAPIASFYLSADGYREENRIKPKSMWEILNLKSDLEVQITTMESAIQKAQTLERALEESQETYRLALDGANAGIWDWDIVRNHIMYSPKFYEIIGSTKDEVGSRIEDFRSILHPDDVASVFAHVEESQKNHHHYSVEFRLRCKDGGYKWCLSGGITKYSKENVPVRMVGSIIDINENKKLYESVKDKMGELEKMNTIMVNRELQMVKLKEELEKSQQGTQS